MKHSVSWASPSKWMRRTLESMLKSELSGKSLIENRQLSHTHTAPPPQGGEDLSEALICLCSSPCLPGWLLARDLDDKERGEAASLLGNEIPSGLDYLCQVQRGLVPG